MAIEVITIRPATFLHSIAGGFKEFLREVRKDASNTVVEGYKTSKYKKY